MKKITRIKLFISDNDKSKMVGLELKNKLINLGYIIVDDDCDLGIAIGGDGTFLNMVRECCFNEDIYYIGVNTGTLGFAQDIYPDNIDEFLSILQNNQYHEKLVGYEENVISSGSNSYVYKSLNEVVVRDKNLGTAYLNVYINDVFLERFTGDGILISTPFGSTAYNLSLGGSIISDELSALEITPIAPLNNNKYHNLTSSIIVPDTKLIRIVPVERTRDLIVIFDGKREAFDDVKEINTSVNKKIRCMKFGNCDYTTKINEKFLK